jgi:hypothetical protein
MPPSPSSRRGAPPAFVSQDPLRKSPVMISNSPRSKTGNKTGLGPEFTWPSEPPACWCPVSRNGAAVKPPSPAQAERPGAHQEETEWSSGWPQRGYPYPLQ